MECAVFDAEALVGKLQEGDPEVVVLELGQPHFDRPGTFGDGESLVQAAQEMSREQDHVGGVVESTKQSPERFTGHAWFVHHGLQGGRPCGELVKRQRDQETARVDEPPQDDLEYQ